MAETSGFIASVKHKKQRKCNAALYSRRKKHFIFDSINIITALSFRWPHTAVNETVQSVLSSTLSAPDPSHISQIR